MSFLPLVQQLSHVISIPITPFDTELQIDWQLYERLLQRLVNGGIRVITPNGNTSEFYSLTPTECEQIVQIAGQYASDDIVILAGIGHDVATAINMGKQAAATGVQAVMIHQPPHPFRSVEGWLNYNKTIADALPDMGIVPYLRELAIRADHLTYLVDVCPNVVGVKYAVPDAQLFTAIRHAVQANSFAWICGLAEGWAPYFWIGGAVGFTSGLVNVDPSMGLTMFHYLKAGDFTQAMNIWHNIKSFEDLRARNHNALNVSVVKEAMCQMNLCRADVRPPISRLNHDEQSEVTRILTSWQSQSLMNTRENS